MVLQSRSFEPELDDAGVPIGCPKCGGLKGGTPMCCKKDEPLPTGKKLIQPEVGEPVEIEEEDEVILEEEEASEEVVEEEESDDDDEDLEAYLEELPVKELKKLCEEADLSKKGKKADLVARLLE